MGRVMLRIFQFGPVLLAILFLADRAFERSRVDSLVRRPDSIRWGTPPDPVAIEFHLGEDGEEQRYSLRLSRGQEVLHFEEGAISWDLFGGGFVGAMDVDLDPERELVIYGTLVRRGGSDLLERSHFIDFSGGHVTIEPFDRASADARKTASRWMQSHVALPMEVAVTGFLLLLYYAALAAVLAVGWAVVRARRSAPPTAEKGASATPPGGESDASGDGPPH